MKKTGLIGKALLAGIAGALMFSCSSKQAPADETVAEAEARAEESPAPEWATLDRSAWRNYKADTLSPMWAEEDGIFMLTGGGGGDIVTRDQYENFELEMEWKISEKGNSGVFFRVVEHDTLGAVYHSGPEMQILDNAGHPDAAIPTHRAGDNYDLQACSEETVKPAGEWNQARLVVNEGKVEHWLNGTKVVEYQIDSPEWQEQYNNSKFTQWPAYAKSAVGHIALQDHSDPVWFRNIRIRKL